MFFCVSGLNCGWGGYLCGSCIFLLWFKCPCTVATEFGKYLRTRLDVNPGNYWKLFLSMSYIHVDGTGMNSTSCRYYISSGKNEVLCTFSLYYSCGGGGDSLG